ncbi:MAG TPA: DUF2723 domain-containing protein, partial [Candidatus Polarisedimenticolia bacterium]|nr:DUF2723 domain-containing protein [Candidatus Polarisedimenticolia bacterium]
DSGELILAAHSLGIPHPPGYPLWLLLARLADALPWGTAALRVNALSAVLAALATGLFYLLAARCGLSRAGRIAGTIVFAGSTLVWDAAVQAEVYGVAAVLFLLLAHTALRARARRTAGARSDALFFLVAGVAPLAHQTLLFPAVILAGWVLTRRFTAARLGLALLWMAVGFSMVALLPVRSGAHPWLDWGQDRNLASLWDNLLRRNYGGLRQNEWRVGLAVDELTAMGGLLTAACGIAAMALSALGAVVAGRRRAALQPLSLAALLIPLSLMILLAFTPDAEHLAQVGPFLIPVVAVLGLWTGAGLERGARLLPEASRVPLQAVCVAALVVTLGFHFRLCDRGSLRLPERYGRDLLSALPSGATLVVDGDNETFLTAYLTRVEGYRQDVHLVNRRGHVFGDPYGLSGVPRTQWAPIQHRVDMERLSTSKAPVYYATPPADLVESGVQFQNVGLVYLATLPRELDPYAGKRMVPPSSNVESWPRSSDLLPGGPERYDYVTRKLAVGYSGVRAQTLWEQGRYQEALPWFQDAARVGFDFPAARMNLAVAAAATGNAETTLSELLTALKLAPYDPEPSARLAVLFAVGGRYRDAATYFERAYRIRPSAELAANAARAWSLAGEAKRARVWEARR